MSTSTPPHDRDGITAAYGFGYAPPAEGTPQVGNRGGCGVSASRFSEDNRTPANAAIGRGMAAYLALKAKGCTCGDESYTPCPIHIEQGDNRGIRVWFQAGMPGGFPFDMTCIICGSGGLCYPNVEIDDPEGSGEYKPTLICPRCSTPASERSLVAEATRYKLNDRRVFA